MFDEDDMHTALGAVCPCGSGNDYGACCGSKQQCDCGSEETAAECCYAEEVDAEVAEFDPEEWN